MPRDATIWEPGWQGRIIRTGIVALVASMAAMSAAWAGTWDHARGDAANTGFANVVTNPALRPERIVTGIGSYAFGSGPVIGPDGTVYLGDRAGNLRAFRPEGTPLWAIGLPHANSIDASPVVDSDGSIYVVGNLTARTQRGGRIVEIREARLYKVLPGGGLAWEAPFPERFEIFPHTTRGRTTAPPNIWRHQGLSAVVVPAYYPNLNGFDLQLVAFTPFGSVMSDTRVATITRDVSGGSSIWGWIRDFFSLRFSTNVPAFPFAPLPDPGVAIAPRDGASPAIVLTEGLTGGTLAFELSQAVGLRLLYRRVHRGRVPLTTGLSLSDGAVLAPTARRNGDGILTDPRIARTRIDGQGYMDVTGITESVAPLTRMLDGRVISVTRDFGIEVFSIPTLQLSVPLQGQSIAPAAASRNHVFVSTTAGFHSIDARTLDVVGRFDWTRGGLSSPALGPDGRIYALAADALHIWPGRPQTWICGPQSPIRCPPLGGDLPPLQPVP